MSEQQGQILDEADELMSGGDGVYAPSFKFAKIGDTVRGEVTHVSVEDQMKYVSTGKSTDPIIDPKTGKPKRQIRVILQTELRNWDKVAKIPVDEDNQEQPASNDTGERAIYVRGWMLGAVSEAIRKAGKTGAPKLGGKLAVRFTEEKDTGKGNPLKKFDSVYAAPPEGSGAADLMLDDVSATAAKAADTQPDPWQTATQSKSTAEDMPSF